MAKKTKTKLTREQKIVLSFDKGRIRSKQILKNPNKNFEYADSLSSAFNKLEWVEDIIKKELQNKFKIKKRNAIVDVWFQRIRDTISDMKEIREEVLRGKTPSLSLRSLN